MRLGYLGFAGLLPLAAAAQPLDLVLATGRVMDPESGPTPSGMWGYAGGRPRVGGHRRAHHGKYRAEGGMVIAWAMKAEIVDALVASSAAPSS